MNHESYGDLKNGRLKETSRWWIRTPDFHTETGSSHSDSQFPMIISRIVHCLTYESIALACRSRCFMMFFCFEIRLIWVLTIFASKLNPLSQGINILDQGNVAGSSRKTNPQELDELEPWEVSDIPLNSQQNWLGSFRDVTFGRPEIRCTDLYAGSSHTCFSYAELGVQVYFLVPMIPYGGIYSDIYITDRNHTNFYHWEEHFSKPA